MILSAHGEVIVVGSFICSVRTHRIQELFFQSSGLKDKYKRPIRKQCDATMRSLPSGARLVGYGDENGRDITGTLINFNQRTDHPDVVQFHDPYQ